MTRSIRAASVVMFGALALGTGWVSTDALPALGSSAATQADGGVEDPGAGGQGEALTPVVVSVVAPQDTLAVRGTDGRYHVVYELSLTNGFPSPARLEAVTVLNAADGTEILSFKGKDMIKSQALRLVDHRPAKTTSLPPNAGRVLLVTVSFESEDAVPQALDHRIDVRSTSPLSLDPSAKPERFSYRAGSLDLSRRAVPVFSRPLEGGGWVANAGCCDPDGGHISAVLPINGTLVASERFAIDWMRVDDTGRLVTGDPTKLSNWVSYGAKVMAVADGVVIEASDGAKDQTPGEPPNLPLKEVPGNHVVIDHGDGLYGFYAHLKPGTVSFKVGDQVRSGDQLGQLGNSGGSGAPHLHLHLVSGPSPLASDGMPYVIDSFALAGVAKPGDLEDALKGKARFPSRAGLSPVEHTMELPLSFAIVDFTSR
jgi:hypothetical protein